MTSNKYPLNIVEKPEGRFVPYEEVLPLLKIIQLQEALLAKQAEQMEAIGAGGVSGKLITSPEAAEQVTIQTVASDNAAIDYEALYEQMCERCDALDAELAKHEQKEQVEKTKDIGARLTSHRFRLDEAKVAEPVSEHPDDAAVDAFAAQMKTKLAKKRADGRGGWQACSAQHLSNLLREHVHKGDPIDVANLAMMLHQNGQRIDPVSVPSDYWREKVDEIANNIGEALNASDNQLLVDDISVYVTQLFELTRYGNAAPEPDGRKGAKHTSS